MVLVFVTFTCLLNLSMHCDFDFCQATFCFRRISLHVPLPFTHIIILLISNEDLSKHKHKKLRTFTFGLREMDVHCTSVLRVHIVKSIQEAVSFSIRRPPQWPQLDGIRTKPHGQPENSKNFVFFFCVAFRLYHNNSHLHFVATQQHINVSISS